MKNVAMTFSVSKSIYEWPVGRKILIYGYIFVTFSAEKVIGSIQKKYKIALG